jgi:hypothetical protein
MLLKWLFEKYFVNMDWIEMVPVGVQGCKGRYDMNGLL